MSSICLLSKLSDHYVKKLNKYFKSMYLTDFCLNLRFIICEGSLPFWGWLLQHKPSIQKQWLFLYLSIFCTTVVLVVFPCTSVSCGNYVDELCISLSLTWCLCGSSWMRKLKDIRSRNKKIKRWKIKSSVSEG